MTKKELISAIPGAIEMGLQIAPSIFLELWCDDEEIPEYVVRLFMRVPEEPQPIQLRMGLGMMNEMDAMLRDYLINNNSLKDLPVYRATDKSMNNVAFNPDYLERIARVCHEANRSHCESAGDMSQKPWDQAEQWQRDSAMAGVAFRINNPDAGESAQHDAWMADKIADGWVYGEVKDAEKKTHPCIVSFNELPVFQQRKDKIFCGIVDLMTGKVEKPINQERLVDIINHMIEVHKPDTNKISDGYHTFGELYDHRIALWIRLCKTHPMAWRSKLHSDGSSYDGWFILGIGTEWGHQVTYHIPMSKWDECGIVITLDKAPEFDGHTSADVIKRLKAI